MESTKEVILALKDVRKEKQLSFDKIISMLEKNGQFLSKSTLSRVFADGSEDNGNFRYETLKPIADVLLDIETIEIDDSTDTKAYKTILKLKKDLIIDYANKVKELKNEIEVLNKQLDERVHKEKMKYHEKLEKETLQFQRSIDFVKHQVELKDQRIDALLNTTTELMSINNKLLQQLMECPYRKEGYNGNDTV